MMRLIFIFLLVIASLYIGVQLSQDPGYLLITINHWTLETTVLIAVTGLFLVFIILHSVLFFLNQLSQSSQKYQQWSARRRALKAQSITRQGLIEFSEGYWSLAKNHLIKALPDTDTPLLNYLTAARAAQELGEHQLRDDYLREAQQSMPEAKIAVVLTQAQLQLANQQWEQALATLRHLQDLAPHHPYVLKLLMYLYQEVRDWPQLIDLLPEIKKNKIINDKDFEALRHHAYLQAISDLAKISQADALTALMKKLPSSLKNDPDLIACYCSFLIKDKQELLAESILRRCLQKLYHEQLITLYGQFYINEKQLAFAESLLKKQPNSYALYLCLGCLSNGNHLWGKARSYLEKSIALKATPKALAEIGALFDKLGEKEAACHAYRDGLALATKTS